MSRDGTSAPHPPPDDASDEEGPDAADGTDHDPVAMHRDLARRTAELEEVIRRKDEILAMVSHDLRNPLGSIAGFAELLSRKLDDLLDEPSRRMLGRITYISDHLLTLVDDLLDVSVFERGQLSLEREDVDIGHLVMETVESYRPLAADKDVSVELHVPDGDVVAHVDPDRLLQVVDNLMSNAVKFSPNQAGATIAVTCSRQGGVARITVADEGIGIPDDLRDELFEPFGAGRTPGTAAERSTGLGLAISRSIVSAHGGQIDVDSEPGHGSVFEVTLPATPHPDPAPRA